MVQRRRFRLSDMIPNAWFYKLRDMGGAHGRGGVRTHHRSSSARWSRESVQRPSWDWGSSARWNREADVQHQPEARLNGEEGVQQPVTPTKGSTHSPLPRRASYYYSTRDREVPPPPRAKEAQSPTRSSRRRNRVGHAPEGRRHVSAPVPAHGKEPVVDPTVSSCRRRDMCIKSGGGEETQPRTATAAGPPVDGLNVKVIASENEIIIDFRDEDAPERALRRIVTRPARRHLEPNEPDGSHVDLADVTDRDKDTPERRLRQIATRLARRLPEPNQQEGRHVDLADVTPRASSASERSSVSKPRRSSASSSSGRRRRLKTRANSPRLAATARRGKPPARNCVSPAIAESYAVVKRSWDPRKDFRESMEEMIRAKSIRAAGDLEDLLACYLALNDAEHHDLIIEVFEEIWMSLAGVKP